MNPVEAKKCREKAEAYTVAMEQVRQALMKNRKTSTEDAWKLVASLKTVDYPDNLLKHLVDDCCIRKRFCQDGLGYYFINMSYTSISEENSYKASWLY